MSDDDEEAGSGRDGNGAATPAGGGEDRAARAAKRKPAYGKSRAAALELLQGAAAVAEDLYVWRHC